jgi:ATP-dependent Clp protease ATP-binding subunit ClpA
LDAAQDEARALDYGYVSTEHLLLGLIREADGLVAEVLRSLGLGVEGARVQVQNVTGRGIQPPDSGRIPLTPLSRQVLELAADQARRLKDPSIGQEHLLLALIRESRGEVVRILTRLGSGPAAIRDRYVQFAGLTKPAARSIRVPSGPLFERFTDGYRKVVIRAYAEAWMLGHDHVGTEHLLLALIGIDGEPAAETLSSLRVSLDAARRCVGELSAQPLTARLAPGQESAGQPPGPVALTERATKAMGLALREAMRRRDGYVGTEHLLLALLDEDNTAVRVLVQLGCDPAVIRGLLRS